MFRNICVSKRRPFVTNSSEIKTQELAKKKVCLNFNNIGLRGKKEGSEQTKFFEAKVKTILS